MSVLSWIITFALFTRFLLSGLFEVLRQAMGPEEELDAVKMMNEGNDADEEGEGFGKKCVHWQQTLYD